MWLARLARWGQGVAFVGGAGGGSSGLSGRGAAEEVLEDWCQEVGCGCTVLWFLVVCGGGDTIVNGQGGSVLPLSEALG